MDIGGKSVLEAGRRTNHSPEINLSDVDGGTSEPVYCVHTGGARIDMSVIYVVQLCVIVHNFGYKNRHLR